MANLRGVVHADDDALEHALHARCSHELDKNPGRCGLRAAQGHIGSTTFNNHKAIMGGNDTVCDSKQTSTRYAATTARGRRAS